MILKAQETLAIQVCFGPTLDGIVIPSTYRQDLENGKFAPLESAIIGVVENEGTLFTDPSINSFPAFRTWVTSLLSPDAQKNSSLVNDIVENRYPPQNFRMDYFQAAAAYAGDKQFKCPVLEFAHTLSEKIPTYLYSFERIPDVAAFDKINPFKYLGVVSLSHTFWMMFMNMLPYIVSYVREHVCL